MSQTLTVSLVQNLIFENNPIKTAQTLEQLLSQKKILTSNLVLLPEIFLGSTTRKNEQRTYSDFYKKLFIVLKKNAKKYKISFFGSYLESHENHFYNTAFYIQENGSFRNVYRKMHLFRFDGEEKNYAAGQKTGVFQTSWGKVGAQVCYDIRFPELMRKQCFQGAKMIWVTAQWPKNRRDHWLALLKARAIENQVYILACNRRGTKKSLSFSGDSVVISPWGETLLHLNSKQAIGKIKLDLQLVDRVRKNFPVLKDAHRKRFHL